MFATHHTTRRTKPGRSGFTLVEIMIAISIIAILIAILLPAINSVRTSVRVNHVKSEITNLESAIALFKTEFGIDPPSRITLYPAGNPNAWLGDPRSLGYIRRLWPQFDLNTSGGIGALPGPVTLNGAECLVFFLGGGRDTNGSLVGFSQNPRTPFVLGGTSRKGPFYTEFDLSRLVDVNGNGFSEYADPLPGQTTPYVYVSSNNGRGYGISEDVNRNGTLDPGEDTNRNGVIDSDLAVFGIGATTNLRDIYRQGSATGAPYKANSYQIISAGFDMAYGTGGAFDPDNASALSQNDKDNITNFHGGLLGR